MTQYALQTRHLRESTDCPALGRFVPLCTSLLKTSATKLVTSSTTDQGDAIDMETANPIQGFSSRQSHIEMSVRTKRIYEPAESVDGTRILVDRLWPRGVSKEDAALDRWIKDIAPSDELRRWFDHDPEQWNEFDTRYKDELAHQQDIIDELRELAEDETVTLLYAAKDVDHNNAVVLKEVLEAGR